MMPEPLSHTLQGTWGLFSGSKPLSNARVTLSARQPGAAPLRPSLPDSHSPPPTRRSPAGSLSLIECGPVHTAFPEKLEGGLGGVLDRADAETRDLFSRYLSHSEQIFLEAGQDPEDVTEVSAGPDCGSGGSAPVPQPSPGQRASSRRCRSSSRRCAPRARPCATSPPSASCP